MLLMIPGAFSIHGVDRMMGFPWPEGRGAVCDFNQCDPDLKVHSRYTLEVGMNFEPSYLHKGMPYREE